MSPSIITLTTDFGTGSPYVAQMKGVVLRINPQAVLVDLTHEVPPQHIRQAAWVLQEVAPRFPEATTHVCVVDPGVGTQRKIVLVEADGQRFIAPDNGVLSRVLLGRHPSRVIALGNPEYWQHPVSSTFHGRDIMAPVAAHLSRGVPAERFGQALEQLEMLAWPVPQSDGGQIRGAVLSIDSFGNLITNIDGASLAELGDHAALQVHCAGQTIEGLRQTYGQSAPGSLIALMGSGGLLELAVVRGNAAQRLAAGPDQEVTVIRRDAIGSE